MENIAHVAPAVKVGDRAELTPTPARAPFVRIPNSHLGRIFAAGPKNAAAAVQMLGIKLSYGWQGFVLNESKEGRPINQRGHAVPRDAFQDGLHHLVSAQVLNRRSQGGRRPRDPSNPEVSKRGRYATETLVSASERGVDIPLALLSGGVRNRRICGFIAAALLPPEPITAREAARRIDIVGRVAIDKMVKAAVEAGAIAAVRIVGSDWIVGRDQAAVEAAAAAQTPRQRTKGVVESPVVENSPVENSPVESSPAHSLLNFTSPPSEKISQSPASSAKRYATQPPEASAEPRARRARGGDDDFVILSDWRTAKAFTSGELRISTAGQAVPEAHVDRATWVSILEHYGPAPAHLITDVAHQQAMHLTTELRDCSLERRSPIPVRLIVHGLAAQIAAAVKRGRVIRSLGFVAVNLLQRVIAGDSLWAYNTPSRLTQDRRDPVIGWARRYLAVATAAGIPLEDQALLGTIAIDELAALIPNDAAASELEQQIATAAAPQRRGDCVCAWSYFLRAPRRSTPAATSAPPEPPTPAPAAPTVPPPKTKAKSDFLEMKRLERAEEKRRAAEQEREDRAAVLDPILCRLIAADEAETISLKLLVGDPNGDRGAACTGPRGLREFLEECGRVPDGEVDLFGEPTFAEALAIMVCELRRDALEPSRSQGWRRSWYSFRDTVVIGLARLERERQQAA